MDYIRLIDEMTKAFPYRQQAAVLLCGIILGYLLHIAVFKLHIWRLGKKSKRRSMVLIEPRGYKAGNKKNASSLYYQYIKNAEYSSKK